MASENTHHLHCKYTLIDKITSKARHNIFDMIGDYDPEHKFRLSISVPSLKEFPGDVETRSTFGHYISNHNGDPLAPTIGTEDAIYGIKTGRKKYNKLWPNIEKDPKGNNTDPVAPTPGTKHAGEDKETEKEDEYLEQCFTNNLDPTGYSLKGIAHHSLWGTLVCLWNNKLDEESLGKVVSIEKSFQIFTEKNRRLLVCPTYIAVNDGDICVSDVNAVVVFDIGGMLRFRYAGMSRTCSSNFDPYGICCDSSLNIIVADMLNNTIHLIDKDGQFLHYVTYEGIRMPRALCIEETPDEDKLYVGEWDSDSIKILSRSKNQ